MTLGIYSSAVESLRYTMYILLVGGGGRGGYATGNGGGGGAGGEVRYGKAEVIGGTTLNFIVGSGSTSYDMSSKGGDTYMTSPLTLVGGETLATALGGGNAHYSTSLTSAGYGGGWGRYTPPATFDSSGGLLYSGGNGAGSGGGGGGSTAGPGSTPGNGANGVNLNLYPALGTNAYIGGGGGGGNSTASTSYIGYDGGNGGGGRGSYGRLIFTGRGYSLASYSASSGATGYGGGGGGGTSYRRDGYSGGSGAVMICIPSARFSTYTGSLYTSNATYSNSEEGNASYTRVWFRTSGSIAL